MYEITTSHNGKMTVVKIGQDTFVFSYSTLVGFALPGLGRVKQKNVWGSATGKHLNSWPARYADVPGPVFERLLYELERTARGHGTREGLISRIKRILARNGYEVTA